MYLKLNNCTYAGNQGNWYCNSLDLNDFLMIKGINNSLRFTITLDDRTGYISDTDFIRSLLDKDKSILLEENQLDNLRIKDIVIGNLNDSFKSLNYIRAELEDVFEEKEFDSVYVWFERDYKGNTVTGNIWLYLKCGGFRFIKLNPNISIIEELKKSV